MIFITLFHNISKKPKIARCIINAYSINTDQMHQQKVQMHQDVMITEIMREFEVRINQVEH